MRIAIFGTGGAGGFFGARLARSGEDVVFNGSNVQESGIVVILHGSPTGLHASQPNIFSKPRYMIRTATAGDHP